MSQAGESAPLVVSLTGDVDLDRKPEIEHVLQAALDASAHVVIDLARVHFVDTTGISMLVAAKRDARQRGRTVDIINIDDWVRRVLELTGVPQLLTEP